MIKSHHATQAGPLGIFATDVVARLLTRHLIAQLNTDNTVLKSCETSPAG